MPSPRYPFFIVILLLLTSGCISDTPVQPNQTQQIQEPPPPPPIPPITGSITTSDGITGMIESTDYPGFAVAERFSPTLLSSYTFTSTSDTQTIDLTITDDFVYKYAFISYAGQPWQQINLAGDIGDNYISNPGTATATIPITPSTFGLTIDGQSTSNNYIVTYTCDAQNNCHDGWQIWQFDANLEDSGPVDYTVTASFSETGNTPELTVDGDDGTRWGAYGSGQWIQYSFEDYVTIDNVSIDFFYDNGLRNYYFEIQTSDNGDDWNTIFDGISSGEIDAPESFYFPAVTTQYLRILCLGYDGGVWNSFWEVQWEYSSVTVNCGDGTRNYGETGVDCGGSCLNNDCCVNGVQDPLNGEEGDDCGGNCPDCVLYYDDGGQLVSYTATASSGSAELTRDGIIDSDHWGAYGSGAWLQYSFSQDITIDTVSIAFYRGDERNYYFDIQTSDDGVNWNTIFDGVSSRVIGFQDFNFPTVSTSYLRILGLSNSENPWNAYYEVEWTNNGITVDCTDGTRNYGETGVDCGGSCLNNDCCVNGVQDPLNGEEGDDCGGSCSPCPTCFDHIQNQEEQGIDCEGPCPFACPTCSDTTQNQGETELDCGGPNCAPCLSCNDGEMNVHYDSTYEDGVDCGGTACPQNDCSENGYLDANLGEVGIDCTDTASCCSNGYMDNKDCVGDDCGELGIDCGGSCSQSCYSGIIYYVSNSGSDTNNGMSPTTPWATISHINDQTFSPGDAILFERGGTWREQLVIDWSGTPDAYITIGAYSEGNKPRILGSNQVTGWVSETSYPNIWRSANSFEIPLTGYSNNLPGSIFFGETDETITWGTAQYFQNNVNECGTDFSRLNQEYDWCWENDAIYVYSPNNENPGSRYDFVEVSQRDNCITMQEHNPNEYISIDGLELMYALMYGYNDGWPMDYEASGLKIQNCHIAYLAVRGGDVGYGLQVWHSDMLVRNNDIHDCGRRSISYNVYVDNGRSNEGLVFENVLFEDNVLHNGYHTTGFDISHGDGMVDTFRNFTIRNNFIYDDPNDNPSDGLNDFTSMQIYLWGGDANYEDFKVHNNVLKYAKQNSLNVYNVDDLELYGNVFYGTNPRSGGYRSLASISGENNNLRVNNNIFYGTADRSDVYSRGLFITGGQTTVLDVNNNIYYQIDSDNQDTQHINSQSYIMSEFSQYQSDTGWDSNGYADNPMFVDAENNNFNLISTSPGVNTGLHIPGYHCSTAGDQEGCRVWYGSAPDIGAIEYQE